MSEIKCLNCEKKSLFSTLVKSGFDRKERQRYQCKTCSKIFTGLEKYHRINDEEKASIIKMKQEGLSTRAISRILNRESHVGIYKQLKKN